MPIYPSTKDDQVLYAPLNVYADKNIKLTLLDGSILEIWGDIYYNGVLLGTGGGGGGISGIVVKEDGTILGGGFVALNFSNGLDISGGPTEATIIIDLGEYTGTSLPNARVAGLGTLALKSSIVTADISSDAVDNTKLANMAANSFKGNNTGSAADPIDLSVGQAKTLLALTATDVGLGNVTNTSDANKPVSTAQATAIALKADKTTTISTTGPITGGGDLSANRTFDISTFTPTVKGAVPPPTTVTGLFLKDDGTWATPSGGAGVTDGDKGDIVVSASGATWMLDTAVVTATAKTVLDDTTTAAMLTTLGALPLAGGTLTGDLTMGSNRAVKGTCNAPVSISATGASGILNLSTSAGAGITLTPGSISVGTGYSFYLPADPASATEAATKQYVDTGDTAFTTSTKGAVPSPGGTSTGRFLKDDGTWSSPASAISGIGGVFPFTYNTTITEPPTGNQLRGNNSTFASSTKLWIMETTTDGLDVTIGLGRIKAGFQIYVQNYNNAAQYAIWNVTADSTDKGAYWEVTVAPASSAGTIPGGKVALQSLSSAQASSLFSTSSTAPGLTPGSNGLTTRFLRGDGTWQVIGGGGDALTASPLSQFAATTSLQLLGVMSDETGTGALVFATSPTLVTPNLGTPSAVNLTNGTALPVGGITASTSAALGVGTVELGHATDTTVSRVSAGKIAVEGVNVVTISSTDTLTNKTLTSPTLTTPALGTPASGVLTNCTGLPLSSVSGTLAQLNTAITDADLPAALNGLVGVWKGTAAQYAAIGTKDTNTLYAVVP
jgi:hypothetical protein